MPHRPSLSVLSLVLGLAPAALALAAPVVPVSPNNCISPTMASSPTVACPYCSIARFPWPAPTAPPPWSGCSPTTPGRRNGAMASTIIIIYHPNAHEVLGVARGQARLRLGGEQGQDGEVTAGDVVVLPAGTGHRNLESSADFLVVGAYPPDQQDFITQRADPAPMPVQVELIAQVPVPLTDPVTGREGALPELWR